MSEATKKALLHGLKVFLYAGVSAIIPGIVAYLANDPRYLAFVPVINAIWAGIDKQIKENNLLAGK